MRAQIQADSPREVAFYSESVDLARFPITDLEPSVVALLQKKYRTTPVDAVVAFGVIALDFGERHRAEIWPGAPFIFVSAGDPGLRGKRPAGTTGIPIQFDVAGTLRLAQSLQPNARRIVVIAGTSEYDGYVADAVIQALQRSERKLEVRFLGDASFPEILDDLRKLPPDSIVLYGSLVRDGSGRSHFPPDLVDPISEASAAPVYGFLETYLGLGIVGGSIDSLAGQGRSAGRLTLRVLRGESADAIPIEPAPSVATRVDYRQLQRWRLREERLPAGTLVEHPAADAVAEPSPADRVGRRPPRPSRGGRPRPARPSLRAPPPHPRAVRPASLRAARLGDLRDAHRRRFGSRQRRGGARAAARPGGDGARPVRALRLPAGAQRGPLDARGARLGSVAPRKLPPRGRGAQRLRAAGRGRDRDGRRRRRRPVPTRAPRSPRS